MKERVFLTKVFAVYTLHENVKPLVVRWTDGEFYNIEKITCRQLSASPKDKANMRYSCVIRGKNEVIVYEAPLWYIEKD